MSATVPASAPDASIPPSSSQAAIHLAGHPLPPLIELPSTEGGTVDLFLLSLRRPVLLFLYPHTTSGTIDQRLPSHWNTLAGTTDARAPVDLVSVAQALPRLQAQEPDLAVFGLSLEEPNVQQATQQRWSLPFPLLSDHTLAWQRALDLPISQGTQGGSWLQRTTLLLREGQVTQVQFPVPKPQEAAQEALKMLTAGQPTRSFVDTTTTSSSTMDMHTACSKSDRTEGGTGQRGRGGGGERRMEGNTWRNSLLAIDDATGQVMCVLAYNVPLQGNGANQVETVSRDTTSRTSTLSWMAPAAVYHDNDARRHSRPASVLGIDTFAPPPLPAKPSDRQSSTVTTSNDFGRSQENVNPTDLNHIRTAAYHVEAHRPDLLRDRPLTEIEPHNFDSQSSGSTLDRGPVRKMWRKVIHGDGQRRRRLQEQSASAVEVSTVFDQQQRNDTVASIQAERTETSRITTSAAATLSISKKEGSVERQTIQTDCATMTSSQVRQREDQVWQSAFEDDALPMIGAYTHLAARHSAAHHHGAANTMTDTTLKGGSVLIEFLAGSHMVARLLDGMASCLVPAPKTISLPMAISSSDATMTRGTAKGMTARDPSPSTMNTPEATGMLALIPLLPSHLFWFLGWREGDADDGAKDSSSGGQNADHVQTLSHQLVGLASDGVGWAWQCIRDATMQWWSWPQTGAEGVNSSDAANEERPLTPDAEHQVINAPPVSQGLPSTETWTWTEPNKDTPRPVYRRKRAFPSPLWGFRLRRKGDSIGTDHTNAEGVIEYEAVQEEERTDGLLRRSSRISIIHVDQHGVGRPAMMRNPVST